MSQPPRKIKEIDGFRAIAILLVIAMHLGLDFNWVPVLSPIIGNGWSGVSLFFILSGFLLSSPYVEAALEGRSLPQKSNFFRNRMVRIFPLYFFSLPIFIGLSRVFRGSLHLREITVSEIVRHIFFLENWQPAHANINPPYWSLAVEMQFYMVLPWIGEWVYRKTVKNQLTLVFTSLAFGGSVSLVYRAIVESLIAPGPVQLMWGYTSLFSNAESFAFGIGISVLFHLIKNRRLSHSAPSFLIALGLVSLYLTMCAASATQLPAPMHFYFLSGFNVCWSFLLIGVLLARRTSPIKKLLSSSPLRWVSDISYSLYIWHMWIFWLTTLLTMTLGIPRGTFRSSLNVIISLSLTIAFSTLTYNFVEKPLLSWNRRKKQDLINLGRGLVHG